MALDPEEVKSALARLRPFSGRIFGAGEHRFKLNEPLRDDEVQRFENLHRIQLPPEYRYFISSIGNGGAGPFYGIFPLGFMDFMFGTIPWPEEEGFVGILSEPFPHMDEWNDLSSNPDENGLKSDAPEYDALVEEFEKRYWNGSVMNGAIPICHAGCSLRIWLVVTGDQAGSLWFDKRADLAGVMPVTWDDGSPLTFDVWYEDWLVQCLRDAQLAD